MSFDSNFELKSISLNPNEIWFLPLTNQRDSSMLGLRVGIKNLDTGRIAETKEAVRALIEKGIGQEAARDEIQHLEVVPLPDNPQNLGFVQLIELTKFIEWRKNHNCEDQECPS